MPVAAVVIASAGRRRTLGAARQIRGDAGGKILDVTHHTSTYGPISDSRTFPMTADAGSLIHLTLSAIAPDGGPLIFA